MIQLSQSTARVNQQLNFLVTRSLTWSLSKTRTTGGHRQLTTGAPRGCIFAAADFERKQRFVVLPESGPGMGPPGAGAGVRLPRMDSVTQHLMKRAEVLNTKRAETWTEIRKRNRKVLFGFVAFVLSVYAYTFITMGQDKDLFAPVAGSEQKVKQASAS